MKRGKKEIAHIYIFPTHVLKWVLMHVEAQNLGIRRMMFYFLFIYLYLFIIYLLFIYYYFFNSVR